MNDTTLAGGTGTVIDLDVSGMTCDGCSSSVHDALVALPGVRSASVDHASGKAVVLLSPETSAEDFAFEADAAVHDAGYTLESAREVELATVGEDEGMASCGGHCGCGSAKDETPVQAADEAGCCGGGAGGCC
ncbi:heavy-metal-associated domain-containing protein [Demequina gelatinilytica]|uniref:heavy-metal-associated domain-containing protein n=1 Tax=Demequina gelatinilytica TaxID=1638980 RepID=UPI000783352C|nr:heavy metal-associated domain-containing protein [Demequina gelatinilytica]